jgi:translation initiation factor IF-2
MTIRLNKVTRDLNVGITTVVEFLQKKGYDVESSPNAKITDEQYDELVKEFSKDKNLKKETEKLTQERQTKDRGKSSVAIEGFEESKKEEEIDLRPVNKFKPVGKIDLDALNKKPEAPAQPEPEAVQTSVEERKLNQI